MRIPFFRKRINKSHKFEVVYITDIGLKRSNNEDSILAISGSKTPGGCDAFMIVADGMGGHASGEIASSMAIQGISTFLENREFESTLPEGGYKVVLADAVRHVNNEIYDAGLDNPEGMMGTTCTVLVKIGYELHIAHAGDSRAYLFRDGNLLQLTTDDSWVEEQVAAGNLTSEQARVHPNRNIVTQALGIGDTIDVENSSVGLKDKDQILISSDGLHGLVTDQEIESVLQGNNPDESIALLVKKAKEMGGYDNISLAIGKITI